MNETQQLKKMTDILRELSDDWRKNVAILKTVRGSGEVVKSIKRLCKKSNQNNMVKIGLTLIAFPLPIVIDDILGWSFLTIGLIQKKTKNSPLYLEDVYNTFSHIVRELQETRQEIV